MAQGETTNSSATTTHKGSCHCGKIAFEVDGSFDSVLECNCSHCSRKGYLLSFVPRTALRITTDEAAISTYTFNRHAIRHQFCPQCGCAPFGLATGRDGVATAAINVRCLEGIELTTLERKFVDGRSF